MVNNVVQRRRSSILVHVFNGLKRTKNEKMTLLEERERERGGEKIIALNALNIKS